MSETQKVYITPKETYQIPVPKLVYPTERITVESIAIDTLTADPWITPAPKTAMETFDAAIKQAESILASEVTQ